MTHIFTGLFMAFVEPTKHSVVSAVLALFPYAAGICAIIAGANSIQQIPNNNARAALQAIVGTGNLDATRPGLNDAFIAAALDKIIPTITAAKLPPYDNRHLFVENAYVFNVEGLGGQMPTIPFTMTSAFPNSTNLYYAIPSQTGYPDLVQCNTKQWLRVKISGFVSHQPATLTEILNNCHPAGSPDNPWNAIRAKTNLYKTPAGLRDETARGILSRLRLNEFPQTATTFTMDLQGYGETRFFTSMQNASGGGNLHLFHNGKMLVCDSTAVSVSHVQLPNRRTVEDKNGDDFRVREFVTLRMCG